MFKDTVPQHKRRSRMVKALEGIVASSKPHRQKKFSKFLQAVTEAHCEHVAEQLTKAFNDAGLNNLVTGQFPKVRISLDCTVSIIYRVGQKTGLFLEVCNSCIC